RYAAGVRLPFRLLVLVAVALAQAACSGEQGGEVAIAPDDPGRPALQPSEPFTRVVSLDWLGPGGARASLDAWVADTPEKRALGLMHRTALPEDAGMVFVFAQDHAGGFWMRNTRIPLSIAHLSADGEVLVVLDMEPCQTDPCPVYDPGIAYRYAVEANQGWFAEHGIGPGWRVLGGLPPASG
ncbi:MAG TPA: DUF192 domain-containing protein, partial [Egibacteraceae bacterium]|nr:DUF192 domain-containing protein [Egibacteraceae bacterium]